MHVYPNAVIVICYMVAFAHSMSSVHVSVIAVSEMNYMFICSHLSLKTIVKVIWIFEKILGIVYWFLMEPAQTDPVIDRNLVSEMDLVTEGYASLEIADSGQPVIDSAAGNVVPGIPAATHVSEDNAFVS